MSTKRKLTYQGRSGAVINIFRSIYVFLFNQDLPDNNGVFVARATALISVTPKSNSSDLSKVNPALQQQLPYGGASLMPPPSTTLNQRRMINTLVVIVKGDNEGLDGRYQGHPSRQRQSRIGDQQQDRLHSLGISEAERASIACAFKTSR